MFDEVFTPPTVDHTKLGHIELGSTAIDLLLDTHQSEVFGSESGSFTITFNSAGNVFDALTSSLELIPGQRTTIVVSVSVFATTPAIRSDYSIEERQCRFESETDSQSMFQRHSKKACEFECTLARTIEVVGCAPWNFAHDVDSVQLCTRDFVGYFEGNFTDIKKSPVCRFV